jgi:hypothetical protein
MLWYVPTVKAEPLSVTIPQALMPDTIVAWHPEQITAAVDGEVIVMGLIRGQYVGLDDVGSILWKLLEQPQTIRGLCDDLGQRFQGDPGVILADVTAFLTELQDLDLIQAVDAADVALTSQ